MWRKPVLAYLEGMNSVKSQSFTNFSFLIPLHLQHRSRQGAEQHFQGENSLPRGVFEMRILAAFQ